jgi:hypothetical protein
MPLAVPKTDIEKRWYNLGRKHERRRVLRELNRLTLHYIQNRNLHPAFVSLSDWVSQVYKGARCRDM